MTKAQILKELGIERPRKPRLNRKKLALEISSLREERPTKVYLSGQCFAYAQASIFGKIRSRIENGNGAITDEELGFLKAILMVRNLHYLLDNKDEVTHGEIYDVMEDAWNGKITENEVILCEN
ncbi:hypothetical protein P4U44_04280 [Alkalihalobacillus alcalophilus]|nr:hypothetical protein [Alkalihalobacillus alcalophilus]AJA42388.1 hypothetical protein BalMu1_B10 [Bacillus phage BalMu-1]MED1561133.1 hypothetical protein [Alkalihalobacillus alcalophilus]